MSLETYRRATQHGTHSKSSQSSVSTYRGSSLEDARKAAQKDLGPHFTVLATRRIPREGVFGFFGAEEYEVTALKKHEPEAPVNLHPFARIAREAEMSTASSPSELSAIRNEVRTEVRSLRSLIARTASDVPHDASVRRGLESEIAELREMLADLRSERETPAQIKRRVATIGIEGSAARTVIARMREHGGTGTEHDLKTALIALIGLAPYPILSEPRSLIALVGPTGVGKTTTAAKLAAQAIILHKRSVTLVSCDGFRVGATAQMERYAELLGAELRLAHSPAELQEAVATSSSDITIVDTGGRGPAERNGVEASIARIKLGKAESKTTRHTLLCMPAFMRDGDARRVFRFFSACSPTALVVTKIDETAAPAGIVHAVLAANLPIAALCFGQRVPEDIAPASSEAILEVLLPEKSGRKAQDRS